MRASILAALTLLAAPAVAEGPPDTAEPAPDPDRAAAALAPVEPERPEVGGRPSPTLRRTREGGYRYEGGPFDAEISPDGSIAFDDQFPIQFIPPNVSIEETPLTPRPPDVGDPLTLPLPVLDLGLTLGFDLTELLMLLRGEDPHTVERMWLARETEGLRDRLADEHRARTLDRALAELTPRLDRIWRAVWRPPRERRAEIFEAWDECDEDEAGERARRIIEDFVRDRLPCGSPHGYSDAELRALDVLRVSGRPFEPYSAVGHPEPTP